MDFSSQNSAYEALSIEGRFGRISYFAWHMLMGIALLLILATAYLIQPDLFLHNGQIYFNSSSIIALLLLCFSQLAVVYFHLIFSIRRLHDCGQNAWWAVLCLIPFANLILAIYLLFKAGDAEKNHFGEIRHTLAWEKYISYLAVPILGVILVSYF